MESGLVTVWQMKAETRCRNRVALQPIGASFLAVALYNAVLAAEARFSLVDACPWPLVALGIACGAAREGVENDRSSRP
jgi:hypothetical protein